MFLVCGVYELWQGEKKTEHFEDTEKNIGAYAIKLLIIRIPLNVLLTLPARTKCNQHDRKAATVNSEKDRKKVSEYEKMFHVN